MAENQKPLSDFISSVEQVDVPVEGVEEEVKEEVKQKKSKVFPILVGILLFFIIGMGGYYIYNEYLVEKNVEEVPLDDELPIDSEVEDETEESAFPLFEMEIPDEQKQDTDSTIFSFKLPNGWSSSESGVISNGLFSITIVKNPIITGGGWGFMYEGVSDTFETRVTFHVINGETVEKVTHILPTDEIYDSGQINIFAGSVFASEGSNVNTPQLELGGEPYLIKYEYKGENAISIDSQEYLTFVEIMDAIVESITIK